MEVAEAYNGMELQNNLQFSEGQQALRDVLSQRLPSFYQRAYRYLRNTADAEDAVQDAVLSAYKNLNQFRGQAHISTWLTVIVMNCARMQLRRRPRALHLSLDERIGDEREYSLSEILADNEPTPEDQCQQRQLRACLMQLVEQLSPSMRNAFKLRELEGLSTSETAQQLGLSEGTVKAQLARARAKLTVLMRRALYPNNRSRTTAPRPNSIDK